MYEHCSAEVNVSVPTILKIGDVIGVKALMPKQRVSSGTPGKPL